MAAPQIPQTLSAESHAARARRAQLRRAMSVGLSQPLSSAVRPGTLTICDMLARIKVAAVDP
jgi:hypothetical protein